MKDNKESLRLHVINAPIFFGFLCCDVVDICYLLFDKRSICVLEIGGEQI